MVMDYRKSNRRYRASLDRARRSEAGGDLDGAIEFYAQAVRLAPDREALPYRRLAELLKRRGDWESVCSVYRRARRNHPHLPLGWRGELDALIRLGRAEQARVTIAELVKYLQPIEISTGG